MSNPYTTPSYMMVIGSVLAIGAASQLVRGGSRSMHRDDCATQIDHTLRCTCARERAWERSAHAGGGMTPAVGRYKNVTIKEGLSGSGRKVFGVQAEVAPYTPGGRTRYVNENFTTRAEAENWITHAMPGAKMPNDPEEF